jgi:hypothetical protein
MFAESLLAVAGLFTVGVLIGLVLLLTGQSVIAAVARSVADDVSKAFWAGVLWQLLAVPILAVLVLACGITIVGIFAIPVVALAWLLAYAGAFTLGTLAVAVVVGRAIGGRLGAHSEQGATWRALVLGVLLLSVPWLAVAVTEWWSRPMAAVFSWAVATVGLGAVVRSRLGVATVSLRGLPLAGRGNWRPWMDGGAGARPAGARPAGARPAGAPWPGASWGGSAAEPPRDPNEVARVDWETPTPVQGVAAARRPAEGSEGS